MTYEELTKVIDVLKNNLDDFEVDELPVVFELHDSDDGYIDIEEVEFRFTVPTDLDWKCPKLVLKGS